MKRIALLISALLPLLAASVRIQAQCEKYGIVLEDWFPLGGQMSQGALFRDPVIMEIAEAHGKSPVQIILRWHVQDGRSAIPGSKTPSHIDENIDIFDFELTAEDMQKIRGINKEDPFFKMPGQNVRRMSETNNVVPRF